MERIAQLLKFMGLALVLVACEVNVNEAFSIGLWDISNAFFHAHMEEDVYVVPPPGEDDRGVVWQLLKAMYGTGRAIKLFQHLAMEVLTAQGLTRLQVTIMVIWQLERGMFVVRVATTSWPKPATQSSCG